MTDDHVTGKVFRRYGAPKIERFALEARMLDTCKVKIMVLHHVLTRLNRALLIS